MTLKRPPRLATWLLKHLGCSPNNEAVIGDLHERYQLRPRAIWYCHQALGAIAKSFFSETWGHKLYAAYALVVGWATLISIWWICASAVGNPAVWTHHVCTFFWFVAGAGSGCAVGFFTKRPKRPMVLLYVASIQLFLILVHRRATESYIGWYWIDAAVLTFSIALGALPISSGAPRSLASEGESTC